MEGHKRNSGQQKGRRASKTISSKTVTGPEPVFGIIKSQVTDEWKAGLTGTESQGRDTAVNAVTSIKGTGC